MALASICGYDSESDSEKDTDKQCSAANTGESAAAIGSKAATPQPKK